MLLNSVFFPLQKESLVLHLFLFLLCPRKTVVRHTGELGGAALFKLESHGPKGPEEMMVELRWGQRQAREIGHIQASLIEIFGKQLHCVTEVEVSRSLDTCIFIRTNKEIHDCKSICYFEFPVIVLPSRKALRNCA